jgi:hypothetical protein
VQEEGDVAPGVTE